jgi:hypothetical protein
VPLFIIERNFAEKIEVTKEMVARDLAVDADEGIRWILSFLSADRKKTYCLYEAPDPEPIRAAARRLGIPADVIIEVDELHPEAYV